MSKITHLKDYRALNFNLDSIYLEFNLDKKVTTVFSEMKFSNFKDKELLLYGKNLRLEKICLNQKKFNFEKTEEGILLKKLPEEFSLQIENSIFPIKNTSLSGLYQSGKILVTQNEPQGFRKITFFPDRPDVMTKFTTKLIGNKKEFPIMLSNGNLIESGVLENEKHFAVWQDPFKKPSYLFAIACGKLDLLQDEFITISGRKIDLRIYTDPGQSHRAKFAMQSLKNAMKWDENKFGLEYDLDLYMIVSVDSFNSGAMENKGLNIFNSRLILADEEKSTDADFMNIEGVIAHEYFHNWTGNRVTCRDWFQLTLKEGLTVFRDQLFSADMRDKTLQRISDVEILKAYQFSEDASPNAHSIKPKEYLEIRNFYTTTIYEKGSEIIRMIETILGEKGFKKGIDLYFKRHDGQAVTTEDFIMAMEDANNFDFSEFKHWYDEIGTPRLEVSEKFENKNYTLKINKRTKALLPLKYSLYNKEGVILKSETLYLLDKLEINLKTEKKPILSLNQNFSAPIIHNYKHPLEEILFLVEHDKDFFNRYDAVQRIYTEDILNGNFENSLLTFKKVLNSNINNYLKSFMLKLPNYQNIFSHYDKNLIIKKVYKNIKKIKLEIKNKFEDQLLEIIKKTSGTKSSDLSQETMGKRALKNIALSYLNDKKLAKDIYFTSSTMTEKLKAMQIANNKEIFADYLKKYGDDINMLMTYFQIIATRDRENPLEKIKLILKSELFDYKIPNLVRGLIGAFTMNYLHFFTEEGFNFFAKELKKIDRINPETASRLCGSINLYPKLNVKTQKIIYNNLKEFYQGGNISKNTYEILNKIFEK